ncbi:MAG: system, glucose subfamily, subunit [Actinomycetia bacterium]|nr:system, glucose subfamily, subunit [Actinomycetes bacterium]
MTRVLAPVRGRVVGLAGVPDPLFAQAMVGPGTAIDPVREPGEAVAPIDGRIVKLRPHCYVVLGAEGHHGILVYLGVDTVELKGTGFELLAAEGDRVVAGQPLIRWNPAEVAAGGRSPVCPVIALDAGIEALSDVAVPGDIECGGALFTWT